MRWLLLAVLAVSLLVLCPSDPSWIWSESLASSSLLQPHSVLPSMASPLLFSLVRLIPVGDLSMRFGLLPLLAFGVYVLVLFRLRILDFKWYRWMSLVPLVLALILRQKGSLCFPGGSGVEFVLATLFFLALSSVGSAVLVSCLLGGLLISVDPGWAVLVLLACCFRCLKGPVRSGHALSSLVMGLSFWLVLPIRSQSSVPGCPIGVSWDHLALASLSTLLREPGPGGVSGVMEGLKSISSGMTWPVWLVGCAGWMALSRPLSLRVMAPVFWVLSAWMGLPYAVPLGAAMALAGHVWMTSGTGATGVAWHRILRWSPGLIAFSVILGLFLQPPRSGSRWSGRDVVASHAFDEVHPPCLFLGASKSGTSEAVFRYYSCLGLDPSRSGFAVEILDRSSLNTLPGYWRFMEGCHPLARLTPEERNAAMPDNLDPPGPALLAAYLAKNERLIVDDQLPRNVYWELDASGGPQVPFLIPFGLWARIETQSVAGLPCIPQEKDAYSAFPLPGPEWPEVGKARALAMFGWGSLQRERKAAGLSYCDPLEAFKKALQEDPGCEEALYGLYLTFKDLGLEDDAVEALQQALVRSPYQRALLGEMANALEDKGDYQAALSFHRRLAGMGRSDPSVPFNYATCLMLAGQGERAIKLYRKLLKDRQLPPSLAGDVLRNLSTHLVSTGKAQEALPVLEQGISLAPEDSEMRLLYGKALDGANRPSEAILVYEELLKKDQENAGLCFNLGMAHASLLHYPEAQAMWEKALSIDPSYTEALLNLQILATQLNYFDASRSSLPPEILAKVTSAMPTPSPSVSAPSATASSAPTVGPGS